MESKYSCAPTKTGIPVEFVFLPGSASDVRALNALPLNLPPESEIYSDSAYTDYTADAVETVKSNQPTNHAKKELQASRPAMESIH